MFGKSDAPTSKQPRYTITVHTVGGEEFEYDLDKVPQPKDDLLAIGDDLFNWSKVVGVVVEDNG